jgi:hypothetical protein
MEGHGHGYFDHIYLGRTIEELDRVTELRKNVVEGPDGQESFDWAFWGEIVAIAVCAVLFVVFIRLCRSGPETG